jgi:hypothetical protein
MRREAYSDGSPYCYVVERGAGGDLEVWATTAEALLAGEVRALASCRVRDGAVAEVRALGGGVGDAGRRLLLARAVGALARGVELGALARAADDPEAARWAAELPWHPVPMAARRAGGGTSLEYRRRVHAGVGLEELQADVLRWRRLGHCPRDDAFALFCAIRREVHARLAGQPPEVKCCEHHAYGAEADEARCAVGALAGTLRRRGARLVSGGGLFVEPFLLPWRGGEAATTLASELDAYCRVEGIDAWSVLEAKRRFCAVATAMRLCAMLPPMAYPALDRLASVVVVPTDEVLRAMVPRGQRVHGEPGAGTYVFGRGGSQMQVFVCALRRMLGECGGEAAWRTAGRLALDVDGALEQTAGVVGRSAVAFVGATAGDDAHAVCGVLLLTRNERMDVTDVRVLLRNSWDGELDVEEAVLHRVYSHAQLRREARVALRWASAQHGTQDAEGSCVMHAAMLALKMARELGPGQPPADLPRRLREPCEPQYAAACAAAVGRCGDWSRRFGISLECTALFCERDGELTLCANVQCNGEVMLAAWTAAEAARLRLRGRADYHDFDDVHDLVGSSDLTAEWPWDDEDRDYGRADAEAAGLVRRLERAMGAAAARRGAPVTVKMYRGRVWPADRGDVAEAVMWALRDAGYERRRRLRYVRKRYAPAP